MLKCSPTTCCILKECSSDLVMHFHKVRGLTQDKLKFWERTVKTKAAQANISGLFFFWIPSMGYAPKNLEPTLTTMQYHNIFLLEPSTFIFQTDHCRFVMLVWQGTEYWVHTVVYILLCNINFFLKLTSSQYFTLLEEHFKTLVQYIWRERTQQKTKTANH